MPRLATKLVKLRAACEALAIGRTTFWSSWHAVFTDPRSREALILSARNAPTR
jgi:hypothetical protein